MSQVPRRSNDGETRILVLHWHALFRDPMNPFILYPADHGLINYKDTKSKCCYLKNWSKSFGRSCTLNSRFSQLWFCTPNWYASPVLRFCLLQRWLVFYCVHCPDKRGLCYPLQTQMFYSRFMDMVVYLVRKRQVFQVRSILFLLLIIRFLKNITVYWKEDVAVLCRWWRYLYGHS